jgi:hypothetical protein
LYISFFYTTSTSSTFYLGHPCQAVDFTKAKNCYGVSPGQSAHCAVPARRSACSRSAAKGLSGTGPKAGGPHYLLRFATERTLTVNTAAVGGVTELLTRP